jgi:hypothetical protein
MYKHDRKRKGHFDLRNLEDDFAKANRAHIWIALFLGLYPYGH